MQKLLSLVWRRSNHGTLANVSHLQRAEGGKKTWLLSDSHKSVHSHFLFINLEVTKRALQWIMLLQGEAGKIYKGKNTKVFHWISNIMRGTKLLITSQNSVILHCLNKKKSVILKLLLVSVSCLFQGAVCRPCDCFFRPFFHPKSMQLMALDLNTICLSHLNQIFLLTLSLFIGADTNQWCPRSKSVSSCQY